MYKSARVVLICKSSPLLSVKVSRCFSDLIAEGFWFVSTYKLLNSCAADILSGSVFKIS